jgi:Zinc finger, C3HC4 type (RING finger)
MQQLAAAPSAVCLSWAWRTLAAGWRLSVCLGHGALWLLGGGRRRMLGNWCVCIGVAAGGEADVCPVCQEPLAEELSVLSCGHQLCCKCTMALVDRCVQAPQVRSGPAHSKRTALFLFFSHEARRVRSRSF